MSAQMDLLAPCRVPDAHTQCHTLLRAMQRGERLTVATALLTYRVYALSQRCGQLREEYGWPIRSQFVGKFKEYWLETRGEG